MSAAARALSPGEGRVVLEMGPLAVASDRPGHVLQLREDLRTRAGDFVFVEVAALDDSAVWADAMLGLRRPVTGRVSLLGNDWSELDPEACNGLRARVGRAFGRGNWLEHLSLGDNILLPSLHHGDRPVIELRREAQRIARALGLPGVPLGMPRDQQRLDLQRAALVRALLGTPLLLVLEDPTGGFRHELQAPLLRLLRTHRDRGAAVVWLSTRSTVWRDPSIPATARYRQVGDTMMRVGLR